MILRRFNRLLLQTLLLPVVALLLVSGALVWQIENAESAVADIQNTDHDIASATYIMALVFDEDTGLRGFQNTSNESFLDPYRHASAQLQSNVTQLRNDLVAHGSDTAALDDFVATHQAWVDKVANPMIALVRNGGNTRDVAINLRGKGDMDQMRGLLTQIINDEKMRRQTKVEIWQGQVRRTLASIIGSATVLGLLIGLFARSRLHLVTQSFQSALNAQRRNAQATYDSEQRLRTTLTSIGDGVVVCDNHGRIELLNTVSEHLTGWSQADAFHRHISEVFQILDEATREPLENPVDVVLRTRRASSLSTHAVLVRRGGDELHIDDSGSPIFDRAGQLAGVVMVFRDVTEQRRTQAALLASEKLAVSGRLAATLAHEIHNPLDSVVNLLYLMKTGTTPEETEEFLDLARAELDRVTQISRAMLGMYRESKTPIELNLKDLIESVLLLLQRQLTQAGVTLHKDIQGPAVINGYPAELRQVFTNLLTNALDVSTPGTTLEVKLRYAPAIKATPTRNIRPEGVTVEVTDHGSGIPARILEQLFQPFFTTKGEKGTGLGLWVSQGIVQKHGGSINIETRTEGHDRGTTVSVYLPHGSPLVEPAPVPAVVHA